MKSPNCSKCSRRGDLHDVWHDVFKDSGHPVGVVLRCPVCNLYGGILLSLNDWWILEDRAGFGMPVTNQSIYDYIVERAGA